MQAQQRIPHSLILHPCGLACPLCHDSLWCRTYQGVLCISDLRFHGLEHQDIWWIFDGSSCTSLRPKIGFCDLIAILAQSLHIRHHLVRPYIHRILYAEIQGDASVSFAQNGLLSCRPQVRFLPGAPAGNAGSYIVAAACFFAFRLCR